MFIHILLFQYQPLYMRLYNKKPFVKADGIIFQNWEKILALLEQDMNCHKILVIDCYSGIYYSELKKQFQKLSHALFIDTASMFKPEEEIRKMTERFITDDVLFGYMSPLSIEEYFAADKLAEAKNKIESQHGITIIFGYGASIVTHEGLIIYADMPRWEIQQRMRRKEVQGLGVNDGSDTISTQYKRGLFNDWKVLDKHKQTLYERANYWLDTTIRETPKLIDKKTFHTGIQKAASSPFRVVPFFDPAPWGGHWMKEVCDLDRNEINFGWCFDCVPEENSLLLSVNSTLFEMPSINLVYFKSKELLGETVEARFGKEFPIRFDFLDTFGGGNLSLQVHPTVEFAYKNFGLHYTQDESYYILDATHDATVYLGLKSGVDKNEMWHGLEKANEGKGFVFDADKYVNKFPAKKHDHFLIPAGTIHCSGKDTMVLEISATPFIYTFKLWDWNRLGLDGKPRPVNIDRGKHVINWERDTDYAIEQLINQFEVIAEGDGWVEDKTGLHKNEFIETRRHTFSKAVKHYTNGSVNVLNLVDGDEVIVESIHGEFEPIIIHYAETFIVPESVKEYIIRPYGTSVGKECKTIKAYIRI